MKRDLNRPTRQQLGHALNAIQLVSNFCRYAANVADAVQAAIIELERLKTRSYNRKTPLPIDPFLEYLDQVDRELSKKIRRGQFLDFRAGKVRWLAPDRIDHGLVSFAKTALEGYLKHFYGDDFEFIARMPESS